MDFVDVGHNFGRTSYHTKISNNLYINVKKHRLLCGVIENVHNGYKHASQEEPLNLSVDKNIEQVGAIVLDEFLDDRRSLIKTNNYVDNTTTSATDEKQKPETVPKYLNNLPSQITHYTHFKKRKLLQVKIEAEVKIKVVTPNLDETPKQSEEVTSTIRRQKSPFNCIKCPFQTSRKYDLKQHMKKFHARKKRYLYECKACDTKHQNTKTSELPSVCKKCEATQRIQLKKKQQRDSITHQCGNCDYKTIEIESFEEHLRKHAIEEPFRCSLCAFETPWKKEFTFHLERH